MEKPVIYLTRTESISASHRLHNAQLSDEQNREIFGKCNNPEGHGHNYRVEMTVRGTIDPLTGMVANIQVLKEILAKVLEPLDHHHLDKEVPYFRNVVSTTENLCVYVWNEITHCLQSDDVDCSPFELYEVRIYETDKNSAFYRGEVHSSF